MRLHVAHKRFFHPAENNDAQYKNSNPPAGKNDFGVSLTLVNDVVDKLEIIPNEELGAAGMQKKYATGVEPLVVGKKIDEISGIGTISGASLVGHAFEDALESIKQDAKK